jgi:hypothetical protein
MITTIAELIERLEAIKADICPRSLTMSQFEEVGWARRAIDSVLDRARDEAEELSWREKRRSDELALRPLAKCNGEAP